MKRMPSSRLPLSKRTYTLLGLGAATVAASVLLTGAASAEVEGQGNKLEFLSHQVTAYSGQFTKQVPIAAYPWGGKEPAISLHYASTQADGWLGVGWAIAGLPEVTRESSRGGAPEYNNDTDIFFLGGQELIRDCSLLGGNWCTKRQSFQRIEFDSGKWKVWSPDGTKTVFDNKLLAANGWAYRWYPSSVTDPNGNQSNYTYWCDIDDKDCYPDTISYGPSGNATIQFVRELRPNGNCAVFGNGKNLVKTCYRIKTIRVKQNGNLVRRYELGYETSNHSGRSLLTSVQMVGTDGSTTLPATTFDYDSRDGVITYTTFEDDLVRDFQEADTYSVGDFDGDGKMDLLRLFGSQTNMAYCTTDCPRVNFDTMFSRGTAGDFNGTYSYKDHFYDSRANYLFADANGDGLTDIIRVWGWENNDHCNDNCDSTRIWTALSNGDGTFNATHQDFSQDYYAHMKVMAADADGDGKSDVVAVRGLDGPDRSYYWWDTRIFVFKSNGDHTYSVTTDDDGWTFYSKSQWFSTDINGDGRADILQVHGLDNYAYTDGEPCDCTASWGSTCNDTRIISYLGEADGTFKASKRQTFTGIKFCSSEQNYFMGDTNGDGMSDLVAVVGENGNADTRIRTFVSEGDGQFVDRSYTDDTDFNADHHYRLGDMNGDGMKDVVRVTGNNGDTYMTSWISKSDGFYDRRRDTYSPPFDQDYKYFTADKDGDGQTDVLGVRGIGSCSSSPQWCSDTRIHTFRSGAAEPDLIAKVENGYGGVEEVTYKGSSSWDNTYLPAGMVFPTVSSVTVSDGRGWSQETTYDYEGGNWSDAERRFLNFRTVKVYDPTGAFKEIIHTQHVADSPGTVDHIYHRDASGDIFTHVNRDYARSGSGTGNSPYKSHLSSMWSDTCNGDASCKTTKTTYEYHGTYGMMTRKNEYGDTSVSGDERTTNWWYYPNTADYLVNHLAGNNVYQGISTAAGDRIATTLRLYDGGAWMVPPTKGNVTRVQRSLTPSTYGNYVNTDHTYDARGNQTSIKDPLGNTTSFTYDTWDRVTKVTNPLSHTVQTAYTATFGEVSGITDANGQQTTFLYDVLGRTTRVNRPDGGYTLYEYTDLGIPSSQRVTTRVKDSRNTRYSIAYFDGLGRTWRKVKEGYDGNWAQRREQRTTFNSRGLMESQSAPYIAGETAQYTTFEHDAIGRRTKTTHPDGAYTRVVFGQGDEDWKIQTFDERDGKLTHWKDAYGATVQTRELNAGANINTYMEYDLLGNLVQVVDNGGNTATMSYDPLGRKTSMDDPDMGLWWYEYDKAGNLTSQCDARGKCTDFYYDAMNRPTLKQQGNGTFLAEYVYDESRSGYYNKGRVTTVLVDATNNQVTFNYDKMGRLAKKNRKIDGTWYPVLWSYHPDGQVKNIEYPSGAQVSYSYNEAGDPTSVGGYVTGATYDGAGRLLNLALGNGTTLAQQYDAQRGWLIQKEIQKPGGGLWDDLHFAYDAAGNMEEKRSTQRGWDNWLYTYDDLGRLLSADSVGNDNFDQTFTYWNIGNMGSQTVGTETLSYTYNTSVVTHAPVKVNGVSLSYDANGNRTSYGSHSYAYDHENRLSSADNVNYSYDGQGKLIKAGNRVLMDKLHMVEQGEAFDYIFLGSMRIARVDSAGVAMYYFGDHLGTQRVMTGDDGDKLSHMTVLPYGRREGLWGSPTSDFGLAGERIDDNGLYHMGARFLDPELGQFTQPDPSGYVTGDLPQTLNRFSYAYNNPVMFSDPSGFYGVVTGYSGIRNPAGSTNFGASSLAIDAFADAMLGQGVDTMTANSGGFLAGFTATPDANQVEAMQSNLGQSGNNAAVFHSNANAGLHQVATTNPGLLANTDIYALAPAVTAQQVYETACIAIANGSSYSVVVGQFDAVTGLVVGPSTPFAHVQAALAAGGKAFVALGARHSSIEISSAVASGNVAELASPHELAEMGYTMTNHDFYNDSDGNFHEEYDAAGGHISTTYTSSGTYSSFSVNDSYSGGGDNGFGASPADVAACGGLY